MSISQTTDDDLSALLGTPSEDHDSGSENDSIASYSVWLPTNLLSFTVLAVGASIAL